MRAQVSGPVCSRVPHYHSSMNHSYLLQCKRLALVLCGGDSTCIPTVTTVVSNSSLRPSGYWVQFHKVKHIRAAR